MAQGNFKGIKEVKKNEPLAKHTTFGIGGPAEWFCEAKTTKELIKMVKLCRVLKVPYFILGGGSNILVSDNGFRGMVIHNKTFAVETRGCIRNLRSIDHKKFSAATSPRKNFSAATSPVLLRVKSGVMLSDLLNFTLKNGLAGFEFLAGIPGSVGGAVVGNAGTVDEWIDKTIKRVTVLTPDNEIQRLSANQCHFSYRSSRFKRSREIILEADFILKRDKKLAIEARMYAFLRRRRNQPKGCSAGCIFKNLPNHSAGKLIGSCGLKGKRIGNAQISEKHANFIVNLGGAKATGVVQLIKLAKKEVAKKFGIDLEEEICLLGFDKI
jgi:UDP-N-acetylmuramate dehydrogenase